MDKTSSSPVNTDVALLLIRVALGFVFLAHGAAKFADPDTAVSVFASIHLSAFWAYFTAAVEVLGALAMLLGIGVEWAGLVLAILVLGSISLVGGYDLDIMLFLTAIAVSFAGPGRYTLRFAFKKAAP
ncbi:MAG TPA: DoxX family protein [Candidatus Paceibacterota bacterium]|nr:DoxX family protein [Candidatus Paceibacterota bacterium]